MNGKIVLTVPYSNEKGSYVSIRVEDEKSGITFLEINMTMEEFGKFIACPANANCTYELSETENIGKHRIFQFVQAYSNELRELPTSEIKRIASDGWIISESHLKNSNNFRLNPDLNGYKYKVNVGVTKFVGEEND